MELNQATRVCMYCCLRKKPRTLEDVEQKARELGLYYYICPFSKIFYHYHLTRGRNSRSWYKIVRAARFLECLGPSPEDE